jgi:hypothetical protein
VSRKLYLHKQGQGEVELIEVEESITVEELITRHGEDGHHAWVEDGEELVITEVVVEVVTERGHIHIGPDRKVEVTVRYLGEDHSKEYLPGARLKTVLTWAEGAFNVPENQRSDMGLYFRDSEKPLDKGELVGALDGQDHKLLLKMQPTKRENG